jgi:hypothetical protein
VVVTGLQIVVVVVIGAVTGGGVSPGIVVEGLPVVVVVGAVVVVELHVGLGLFFSVDVVTGGRCAFFLGRFVLTVSVIVACHRTRVPAAGDWRRTTIHLPVELPGPRALKNSWTCLMTAYVLARDRPMSRGTRRGRCGFALETRTVAWKCQGTTVPGLGDWPTASRQVPFELPGPLVTK